MIDEGVSYFEINIKNNQNSSKYKILINSEDGYNIINYNSNLFISNDEDIYINNNKNKMTIILII